MKRFVEGEDRRQATLLPDSLEDYVTEDNPVRVVDVFIDELDLEALGFSGVVPEVTGRSFDASEDLPLRLSQSHPVEPAARTGDPTQHRAHVADRPTDAGLQDDRRLPPRQRAGDPRGLRAVRRAAPSVQPFHADYRCDRREQVQGGQQSRQELHSGQGRQAIEQVEASIARYLAVLDRADREDGDMAKAKTIRFKEKIEGLRRQMQSLREIGKQVEAAPDKQVSLTDPDARSMATSGKGTGIVGYNVQIAVDAEHHLIVAHDVTNVGSDRAQLTAMSRKARAASGCEEVTVLADRGYYNGDEVLACEGTGILPVIPKTQTSGNAKRGLFTVADFIYDAENDRYTCPAGEHLTKGKVRSDRRDNIDHYRNLTACLTCELKPRCTPDKVKRLKRWEHESVLDKMQARLAHMPEAMTIRRQTVEHPFGTLKAWMGSTHFLTRTLEKVKSEMSLQVLAYNMKRMINIFGVNPLMQAIAA